MAAADVVFTGGPSLYAARQHEHANVHCLPNAVDVAHFAPSHLQIGSTEHQAEQAQHAGIPHPRLGCYGVIDERMDLALVQELARARPDWQWIMAGPVVKIDPAALPRAPNLHWTGLQSYAVLPYLAAAWDVCIMPFALNKSTRFISPTKTPEYLAAKRPVVSTPVSDVVLLYGPLIRVAASAADFITQCSAALAETPAQHAQRDAAAASLVRQMSWDRAVSVIERQLRDLPPRPAAQVPATRALVESLTMRTSTAREQTVGVPAA